MGNGPRHVPVTTGQDKLEVSIIIPEGTPITQFGPKGGPLVREFTPDVVEALKDINIRGVQVVDTVVAKLMGHSIAIVKDFTHPEKSPETKRIPGLVLDEEVRVDVLDGKLKIFKALSTPHNGMLGYEEL